MALLYQFNTLQPVAGVLEAGGQAILIGVSILVVVAALTFAGYMLMRNNKGSRADDELNLGDFIFVSKDDLKPAKKPDNRPAEGIEADTITNTTAERIKANMITDVAERASVPLKISNMRIEPATKPDEMLTIWFDATNLDSSQIGHQVILKINDRIFNIRQISILPNTMLHLNFKVLITEPGRYDVDVNGTTGIFTVGQ